MINASVFSQSVTDLEGELDKKNQEVKEKESNLERIKREIASINSSSASLDEKLKLIETELVVVQEYIQSSKKLLDIKIKGLKAKEEIISKSKKELNAISNSLYKTSRFGVLDYFFMNNSGKKTLNDFFYKQYILSKKIENFKVKRQEYALINSDKLKLTEEKKDLEKELQNLDKIKVDVLSKKNEYQGLVASKSSQSSSLKKQIGLLKEDISDLQVSILIAKSGTTTSIGNVPSTGDINATLAGFQKTAPPGYFEVFSFGAYTHRLGMSQYGAQARAEIGKQDYQTILKAYYGKNAVSRSTSGNISVQGYGSMNFETKYLYGIAEMPSDWSIEALKAQAVAARTYAYSHYYNKTTICITQSCQVWNPSKSANPPAKWKQAVDQTKGMIVSGVVTYYSATSGGYLTTSGWDTTNKQGGAGWTSNAWESKANSPWFYKSWYRKTYADSSPTCNRYPWLSPNEMMDILNTYLVVKGIDLKGSVNTSRILPVTIASCNIGGGGGSPYSHTEMKSLLNNPVSSISGSPVVNNDSVGNTKSVQFVTNRGAVTVSGADFKQIYNMRAPGYLSIPQNNYVFIDVLRK
jgi:peptidoglycan hydrolase-like amidase